MDEAKCQKFIDALTWSDTSLSLSEFLEKYGVPHLVRVTEGYYGMNEASSFETDQNIMLYTTRIRHNLTGEDSDGRAIAIPFECKNKVLVCPVLMNCRYNRILVAQFPLLYPNVKYFRVLDNHWNGGTNRNLKPESILEIEKIDFGNSCVKFEDVDQVLPLNCPVIFEPLLDCREYTLRQAVKFFGLPAKVRFLSTRQKTKGKDFDNKFENLITNLGKVTVLDYAKPEEVVVATKIDDDSYATGKLTTMNCAQILKGFDLKVCVAKNFENDPLYTNIVKELNKAFLDKYDLKELDNLDKFEYLDLPKGDIIHCYILEPTEGEELAPELPQRNSCIPPSCPPTPPPWRGNQILTPDQSDKQKAETVGETSMISECGAVKKQFKNPDDDRVYESIDSDDEQYEIVDGFNYGHGGMELPKHVTLTSQDNQRHDYMIIPDQPTPPDKYYSTSEYMTIPDLQPTPSVLQKRDNASKNSAEVTTAAPGSETSQTMAPHDDKHYIVSEYMNIPDQPTSPVPQNNSKNSAELTTRLKPDREDSLNVSPISISISESSVAKLSGGESSQKVPIPKDLSTLSVAGVGGMLTSLNMKCYVDKFREEQVDGEMLLELGETELLSLDLKLFHVKKLTKVVKGWRPTKETFV